MSRLLTRFAGYAVLALCLVVYVQHWRSVRLKADRDRHRQNSEALLSDVRRFRIDSATTAVDVKALRLSVDEFERYRAGDLAKIRAMGVKIRNLEAAAKHRMEVAAPIDAIIRDTIIVRDTVPVVAQRVEMLTPHIQMRGVIEGGRLWGEIRVPVTLRQAVWVEYKRRWIFWKRVKAVHQTISSDNPYVQIKYSEYILHREIRAANRPRNRNRIILHTRPYKACFCFIRSFANVPIFLEKSCTLFVPHRSIYAIFHIFGTTKALIAT